jgi:hypothetical protein
VIPPIPKTEAPKVVKLFLSYGFVIAILIIVAGFGLQAYQSFLAAAGDQTGTITTIETHGDNSPAVSGTTGNVHIEGTNQPGSKPKGRQ